MALFIFVLLFVSQLFSSKLTDKETKVRDITTLEGVALDNFRELMGDALYKDYMKSDTYLLRWLKEKHFDPIGASKMLHKTLKWRKENSIDTILDEVLFDADKLPYQIMNGSDYEGNMVAVAMLGKFDARDIILTGRKEIITRVFAQMWESVETTIMKRMGLIGNTPSQGIPVYLQMFEIMEFHYLGYAKHFLFINVPRVFHPLLELGKPIMSRQTKKALQIFPANKKEFRVVLANIIPEDLLKTLKIL